MQFLRRLFERKTREDELCDAGIRDEVEALDFDGPVGPLCEALDSLSPRLSRRAFARAEQAARAADPVHGPTLDFKAQPDP